jgi:hypothetical protein
VSRGLFGLIILALDLWAIVSIFRSRERAGTKGLWTLLILILPLIGFVIWFFAGPRKA